jgi:hypothetical protein
VGSAVRVTVEESGLGSRRVNQPVEAAVTALFVHDCCRVNQPGAAAVTALFVHDCCPVNQPGGGGDVDEPLLPAESAGGE